MPRNKIQNQNIIDRRREDILDAALYLFSLYGYKAVSMNDISKCANCSRTLVYHYYCTKENIFHALMDNIRESIYKITYSLDFELNAKETLLNLIDKLLKSLDSSTKSSAILRLLLNLHLQGEEMPKPPKMKMDMPLKERPLHCIIKYLIEKGQKEGDFYDGDAKEYMIILLSLIEGLSYNKIYLDKKFTCPRAKTIMNIIVKKGIEI